MTIFGFCELVIMTLDIRGNSFFGVKVGKGGKVHIPGQRRGHWVQVKKRRQGFTEVGISSPAAVDIYSSERIVLPSKWNFANWWSSKNSRKSGKWAAKEQWMIKIKIKDISANMGKKLILILPYIVKICKFWTFLGDFSRYIN